MPKHENEFVHLVLEELETFTQENQRNRVLLFPPLPSRLRFLIHRTVEDWSRLSSFSVGESWSRHVCVCFSDIRCEQKQYSDPEEEPVQERPPLRPKTPPKSKTKPARAPRRPDQPLYLPRAVRERLMEQNCGPGEHSEGDRGDHSVLGEAGEAGDHVHGETLSREAKTSDTVEDTSHNQADAAGRRSEQALGTSEETVEHTEGAVNGPAGEVLEIWDEDILDMAALTTQDRGEAAAGDCGGDVCERSDTEELRAEDRGDVPAGDCGGDVYEKLSSCDPENPGLDSDTEELSEEIRPHLTGGAVFLVALVRSDFSSFESASVQSDEFGHVIEIYDFPALFKTEDLMDAFTEYR